MRPPTGARRRLPLLGLALAGVALLAPWSTVAPANADLVHPPVVVSLTYDDGAADQMVAADIMARHAMVGTFYLNSGRLGIDGRISVNQARTLQAAGNEIGGHTVSHANLPTLNSDEQARQICDDRMKLLGYGLDVRNLAYPYGESNADVERVVVNCGYNSARTIGKLSLSNTCTTCTFAEPTPPANPYFVRTPGSVRDTTTLADLQDIVQRAENHGGGWVPLAIHRVCAGCGVYSITPELLDSFLGWLAQRAEGGTTVKTVRDVIGGPLRPGLPGPPPPPPSDPTNLLRNPSMEIDDNGDGAPDCWQRGGYGNNTYRWSITSDAHSGSVAQRVDIPSFADGDRKMVSPQDLGACSPSTVNGHQYELTAWYKTDGRVRLVAFYRDSEDRWNFFSQTADLPASPDSYRLATWTVPPMPAGSRSLAVGFSFRSVGFLIGDDLTLRDTDSTPPVSGITCNGAACASWHKQTVNVGLTATDNAPGPVQIRYTTDGSDPSATNGIPYSGPFNVATSAVVKYRAVDAAGNWEAVGAQAVNIDTVPPGATVAEPADEASVSVAGVYIKAGVFDNEGIARVWFYLDGKALGSRIVTPYQWKWDTTNVAKGAHTLQIVAIDTAGNQTRSVSITVTVI